MEGTWIGSFAGAVALVVLLYLPGFLALAGSRLPKPNVAACAPLVSVAIYELLAIILGKLGILCSWWLLFGGALLVAAAVLVCTRVFARRSGSRGQSSAVRGVSTDWLSLGAYLACGVLFAGVFFVKNLDGPSAFLQLYDNVFHLAVLQSFAETGFWSTLSVDNYGALDAVGPFNSTSQFYPAGWHLLGAMIVDCLGLTTTQAANVVNGTLIAIVFPASMFMLMTTLFPESKVVVRFGALVVMGFAPFPWKFLIWGPLFPNLASMAIAPAVASLFILATRLGVSWRDRVAPATAFLVGCFSIAIMQPNAVFTMGVFLAPYCVGMAYHGAKKHGWGGKRALLAACGCALGVLLVWVLAFVLPPLQDVIWYERSAACSKVQAVANVAFLSLSNFSAQLVFAVAVGGGALLLLFKRKKLWLLASYALMAVIYCFGISSEGFLQHFLAGFWYSDAPRVAANMVFCVVPLAAVFLAWLVSKLQSVARRAYSKMSSRAIAVSLVCLVFVMGVFSPGFRLIGFGDVGSAFTEVTDIARAQYTLRNGVLDQEECDFVKKAMTLIGEDEVVINSPHDGSVFAASTQGLDALYRSINGYRAGSEKSESSLIRGKLNEIATNDDVRKAVREFDVKYVLQLDHGEADAASPHIFTYDANHWRGINAITDETPGFEVVLSEGDMRLYRIVDDAE
ncbi:DUF6541 family protein [Adlercreutzia sp. R7]|uniref:DUF6541 family protein n=1 Tax=Adlercreutzia wanghongyangiae TaxID=3111451 RepID=A0ABU6IGX6_9ACTN|nr:DUF6541 family protein [Adlercreutzia sp. R7]